MKNFLTILCCAGALWAQQSKPIVAVLDLQPQGVSDVVAKALSDELRVNIRRLETFKVIERNQMKQIFMEQDFQQSDECDNENCGVAIGKMLGAGQLVMGSVGSVGKTFIVTTRIIDVATGEIVKAESVKIKGEVDEILSQAVPVIAAKISGYDAEALERFMDDRGLKDLFVHGPSKGQRIRRATFVVGGVAAIAVGGVMYGLRTKDYRAYQRTVDGYEAESLRTSTQRKERTAFVIWGLGGAFLIGGGLSFAF